GTEIGGVQRIPQLRHDLAAALGEYLGEAAALLVAERVVLADHCDAFEAVLQRPISERVRERARRITGNAHDVADALALGEIVSRDDRNEIRRPGSLDVVRYCEAGIREQVSDEEMDVPLLDQATRLLQRDIRV